MRRILEALADSSIALKTGNCQVGAAGISLSPLLRAGDGFLASFR
jgi:hypothetical protein